MKYKAIQTHLAEALGKLAQASQLKSEHVVTTPISTRVSTSSHRSLLNFASSDYLGLANDPQLNQVAAQSLSSKGFGLSSVRFICGTTDAHKALEKEISEFYETEDTIIFPSAYAANSGLFEALLTEEDAVLRDSMCHESVSHGLHLCKAQKFVYANDDMRGLDSKLIEARGRRFKVIVASSTLSATGEFAKIGELCDLADKHGAILIVDEAHGTGVHGDKGRGVAELLGKLSSVEVITSTLEKALGGANGGFVTGKQEVIDLLRQRARPYLFSNSIPTYTVEAARHALRFLRSHPEKLKAIASNAKYFRRQLLKTGFEVLGDERCPICPVLIRDPALAASISSALMAQGVYALPTFPQFVPSELSAVRVQVTAAHTTDDLNHCIEAFKKVKAQLKLPL